jgi:hypothetical protein
MAGDANEIVTESKKAVINTIGEALRSWGLATVLVFVGIAVALGWVDSPLIAANAKLDAHIQNDREIILLLRQQCIAVNSLAKLDTTNCLGGK